MYNSFYGFADDPFRTTPDHRYAYAHHSYRAAKQRLTDSVSRGEGIILVIGDNGTGKTTLVDDILSESPPEKLLALRLAASRTDPEFLIKGMTATIGINTRGVGRSTQLQQIESFLKKQREQGRRVLVAIDDAHILAAAALEQLRVFTALQYEGTPLIQFILLGQESLLDSMKRIKPELGEAITTVKMEPILIEETRALVEYRLKLAWWEDDPNISTNAYELIHQFALGVPSKIMLLCKKLMQYGEKENKHAFDGDDVRIVISQLISELAGKSANQAYPRRETGVTADQPPKTREQGPGTPEKISSPNAAELVDGFTDDPEVKRDLADAQLPAETGADAQPSSEAGAEAQPSPAAGTASFEKLELVKEVKAVEVAETPDEPDRGDMFGYVHSVPLESSERVREKRRVVTRKKRAKTAAVALLIAGVVAGASYFLTSALNQHFFELKEAILEGAQTPTNEAKKVVTSDEQAARERVAREQAAREQAAREQAAREQAAREQAAREQAAREQAAREQAMGEKAAREQAAREKAIREQAAKEQAAREKAARDQAVREKAAQEKAAREQAAREQAAREQAAREEAAKEQAAREKAAKEQAAREQAAKEQAAREQTAREQAAREEAAKEQAAREKAAQEQAAKEQAAREQAAQEKAAQEKAAQEKAAREKPAHGQTTQAQAASEAAVDFAVLSKKLTTNNTTRWMSQKNAYGFYVGNVLNAEYSQDQDMLTVTSEKAGEDLSCTFTVSKPEPVSKPCGRLLGELNKYLSR